MYTTYLLKNYARIAIDILLTASPWITWNLFLAFVPLYLSIYLFREQVPGSQWLPGLNRPLAQRSRSGLWWLLVAVFIAFLPNAPYILTDLIHINRFVLMYNDMWVTALIIAPMFIAFVGGGFATYVMALINVGYYLHKRGHGKWIPMVELILHALCAFGVFLGRFPRLNSWYFVTKPWYVAKLILHTLFDPGSLVVIFLGFIVLSLIYMPSKNVALAIAAYQKKRSISVSFE
jgi:uncharacterized membrane protein